MKITERLKKVTENIKSKSKKAVLITGLVTTLAGALQSCNNTQYEGDPAQISKAVNAQKESDSLVHIFMNSNKDMLANKPVKVRIVNNDLTKEFCTITKEKTNKETLHITFNLDGEDRATYLYQPGKIQRMNPEGEFETITFAWEAEDIYSDIIRVIKHSK